MHRLGVVIHLTCDLETPGSLLQVPICEDGSLEEGYGKVGIYCSDMVPKLYPLMARRRQFLEYSGTLLGQSVSPYPYGNTVCSLLDDCRTHVENIWPTIPASWKEGT